MTNYESFLFSELLDVNYEISTGDHKPVVKLALIKRYSEIVAQLEDSMGAAEWKNFLAMGRGMFTPAGGYGDESMEEVERMMEAVR